MNFKRFLINWCLIGLASGDWVKLPEITNSPKPIIKTISSVNLMPSSFLSNSDVVNRIISHAQPVQTYTFLVESSTTTTTIQPFSTLRPVNRNTQKDNLKHFIQNERYVTTSTAKPLERQEISDVIDRDSFEGTFSGDPSKVKRRPHSKVIFLNQSLPFSTTKSTVSNGMIEIGPVEDEESEEFESEDDGIVVENEDQNSENIKMTHKKKQEEEESEESEEDEDFEDEDDESDEEDNKDFDDKLDLNPPKTRPKAPQKIQKKPPPRQGPQRRIIKFVKARPKNQEPLTFANFIKFLKTVQENFVLKTKSNINDKILALNDFRDNLMRNIQLKIKNLWVVPKKRANRRTKRFVRHDHEAVETEHDGMDFPSAEAALLTISFLTFSVFLIKLVLQVINTIKSKHYSWTAQLDPTLIQTSSVIKKHRNVRRVSLNDEDVHNITKIMDSIESFNPR